MVKDLLVRDLWDLGTKLVRLLDQSGLETSDAFWLYRSDPGQWTFILVSTDVATRGPRQAYEHIQQVIAANQSKLEPINLGDISVMGPNDRLVLDLRSTVSMKPPPAIRITNGSVGDTFIEDAIILRLQ